LKRKRSEIFALTGKSCTGPRNHELTAIFLRAQERCFLAFQPILTTADRWWWVVPWGRTHHQ